MAQFFKVPYKRLASGELATWTKAMILVWLSLKHHENKQTHLCWPSYSTIQKETGLGRAQVASAIRKLSEKGVISVEKEARATGGHRNIYTVDPFEA